MKAVIDTVSEPLYSFNESNLNFWLTKNMGDRFALVMSNESGYDSVQFNRAEWEQVRLKIDSLVDKHCPRKEELK